MTDIFVSYAVEDRAWVEQLVENLTRRGWSVWWDRQLIAGDKFDERIEQALDAAGCILVIWSTFSVASRWCRAEANEGLERNCLVPIRIDDMRLPLVFRGEHTASLERWPQEKAEFGSMMFGIEQCLCRPSENTGDIGSQTRELPDLVPASAPPALAVLPFENMSFDPEQNFMVAGITRDLTELLSMNPNTSVTPYSSVEQYAGSAQPLEEIATELRVRYLVGGGIERRGERFRLRVSLDDTLAATQVWSKHYDEPILTFYDVQDQLEQTISTAIGSEVEVADTQRLATRGVFDLSAYERIQLTEDARRTYSKEAARFIVRNLEELLVQDPDNAIVHAHLAMQLSQNLVSRWADIPEDTAVAMSGHLSKARALAPGDPRVLTAAGVVSQMSGNHQQAVDLLTLSLAGNPNDPHANAVYGWALAFVGRADEGLAYIEGAIQAAPRHPRRAMWQIYLAVARHLSGSIEDAVNEYGKAIDLNPNYYFSYVARAAFSLKLSDSMDVKTDLRMAMTLAPGLTFAEFKAGVLRLFGRVPVQIPWERLEMIWNEVEDESEC